MGYKESGNIFIRNTFFKVKNMISVFFEIWRKNLNKEWERNLCVKFFWKDS